MVASYSSNLRLTKQGDNDNPDTWGQVVNAQVIELLEDAISGVAEIDVTGGSDVNLSTSTVNGGYDDARCMVLELSGIISSNINLIVPAVDKVYIIHTTHTGGTVTVKPSGGSSGIDLVTNDSTILYTKGTSIQSLKGLLAANNLSDVDDAATARTNLGISDFATATLGSGLSYSMGVLSVTVSGQSVGDLKMWPVATAPSGWLNCNGAAVSRTTYSSLFALIGTTFGTGDGSTTFNLPNFSGRSPIGIGQGSTAEGGGLGTNRTLGDKVGYETHTLITNEAPNHTHTFSGTTSSNGDHTHSLPIKGTDTGSGALDAASGTDGSALYTGTDGTHTHTFSGTTAATGGGTSHNNMHPSLAINFIIYTGV